MRSSPDAESADVACARRRLVPRTRTALEHSVNTNVGQNTDFQGHMRSTTTRTSIASDMLKTWSGGPLWNRSSAS